MIGGNVRIIAKFSKWKNPAPIFSSQEIGEFYKKGRVKYRPIKVFLCHNCKKDKELFFLGYFYIGKDSVKWGGSSGCGCGRGHRWTQRELKVKVERQCKKLNYHLIRVNTKDQNKWKFTDKLTLSCSDHGEWNSCTIANFLRDRTCPSCAKASRRHLRITDKSQNILNLCAENGYKMLTKVHNKTRLKDRMSLCCNKGHNFNISVNNFIRGRRCPHCVGKNMDILYLNRVSDLIEGKRFIKIGITKDLDHRIATQNGKNNSKLSLWHAWKFNSVKDCKECEQRLKKFLSRPSDIDYKSLFKDGHSEVFEYDKVFTYRIVEEIIEDYPTYKYTPDKRTSEFWKI